MSYHQKQILLVEDDVSLASTLKPLLADRFHREVVWTHSLARAYELIDQGRVELAILDIYLGNNQTTYELLEYIHTDYFTIKTLMLTRLNEVKDRVSAYHKGASSYLSKPFSTEELLLVVERLLCTHKLSEPEKLIQDHFEVNISAGEVIAGQQKVALRPKEMAIFVVLFANKPNIISKQQILDQVWPELESQPGMNTVEVYLRRLRQKLTKMGVVLTNRRGFGYALSVVKRENTLHTTTLMTGAINID